MPTPMKILALSIVGLVLLSGFCMVKASENWRKDEHKVKSYERLMNASLGVAIFLIVIVLCLHP